MYAFVILKKYDTVFIMKTPHNSTKCQFMVLENEAQQQLQICRIVMYLFQGSNAPWETSLFHHVGYSFAGSASLFLRLASDHTLYKYNIQ